MEYTNYAIVIDIEKDKNGNKRVAVPYVPGDNKLTLRQRFLRRLDQDLSSERMLDYWSRFEGRLTDVLVRGIGAADQQATAMELEW